MDAISAFKVWCLQVGLLFISMIYSVDESRFLKHKLSPLLVFFSAVFSALLLYQSYHLFAIGWEPVPAEAGDFEDAGRPRSIGGAALIYILFGKFLPFTLLFQGLIGFYCFYKVILQSKD